MFTHTYLYIKWHPINLKQTVTVLEADIDLIVIKFIYLVLVKNIYGDITSKGSKVLIG